MNRTHSAASAIGPCTTAGSPRRLGVAVTIIAVMMRTNYVRLAEVAAIAKQFDAPLRVNVYQSVRTDTFALTYDEYWAGFRRCLTRRT